MLASPGRPEAIQNRLLAALPPEVRQLLHPDLEPLSLTLNQVLVAPGQPFPYVYFPTDGMCCLLVVMEDGRSAEVALVGSEGVVGLPLVLGREHSPHQVKCQLPNRGLRMVPDAFRRHVQASAALHELLLRYAGVQLTVSTRNTACTGLHTVEERLARWLLQARDRAGGDEFPLTHSFVAQMLAVRRATVSVIAETLQRRGLISYYRGRITILDAARLEAAACEDYRLIRDEYERLLEPPGTA